MSLIIARERTVEGSNTAKRDYLVACPKQVEPASIRVCANCDRCDGIELDGRVAVQCSAEPNADGSPRR